MTAEGGYFGLQEGKPSSSDGGGHSIRRRPDPGYEGQRPLEKISDAEGGTM